MKDGILVTAKWILKFDNTCIQLETEKGIMDLPAMAVWEAEFERKMIDGYQHSLPSADLSDIRFSRFPIDIGLLIKGTDYSDLSICFAAVRGENTQPLDHISIDQVIHENVWYILDEAVAETIGQLALKNMVVPGPINTGDLIWLRGRDRLLLPVVEQSSIELTENHNAGFELPELNAELFTYQKSGVRFLSYIADQSLGCILADEMGLGKTLQIIGLLASEKRMDRVPNLIICPATLLENWRRELTRFAPQLSVHIHAGSYRTGQPAFFSNFDVTVISYETAVKDELILSSVNWNILSLDEAQNIKNPEAQRTRTVKQMQRRVSVAVTGTPVENRLTDLWSLADFALPGLLGNLRSFEEAFDNNEHHASVLAPLVAPILLRRKVLDVAKDLPLRIDIDQALVVNDTMAVEYESVRNRIMLEYGKQGSLVSIGKLRQLCSHPKLLGLMENITLEDNPKYRRLIEVLEEIFESEEKVLIFTSYLDMSDLITNDLKTRFRKTWISSIDGRVDISKRQPLIDEFTAHNGPGVLVLNPIAAGTGLNITAANHIIHYNPEWNPALEDQASARAYRRMQTRPVSIHHFFYVNTVEEVMMERLRLKRGIAREAVTGHEGKEEILNIAYAMQISPLQQIGKP
jgi:SNF2 family DNA or RNA helicase